MLYVFCDRVLRISTPRRESWNYSMPVTWNRRTVGVTSWCSTASSRQSEAQRSEYMGLHVLVILHTIRVHPLLFPVSVYIEQVFDINSFSSTRCRFLRNKDREANKENYPFLYFPEVYLLHNGYKAFYGANKVYK